MASKSGRLRTREMVLYAILGTLMFVLKMALAGLPNIEPVSLLIILYTVTFGVRALWPIYLYVFLEFATWGLGLWTINYLYIWLILFLLARVFRKMDSPVGWAILSGAYGLCFGLLCTPVYWVSGGWAFAVSWWISGIPSDLVHCVGNFFIMLLLYRPCRKVLATLKAKQ